MNPATACPHFILLLSALFMGTQTWPRQQDGTLHRPGSAVHPLHQPQEVSRGGDPWTASPSLSEGWEKGGIGGVILLNL